MFKFQWIVLTWHSMTSLHKSRVHVYNPSRKIIVEAKNLFRLFCRVYSVVVWVKNWKIFCLRCCWYCEAVGLWQCQRELRNGNNVEVCLNLDVQQQPSAGARVLLKEDYCWIPKNSMLVSNEGYRNDEFISCSLTRSSTVVQQSRYLVDPASSHMLVSKIKPCMCKHKPYMVKPRMAHYNSHSLLDLILLHG